MRLSEDQAVSMELVKYLDVDDGSCRTRLSTGSQHEKFKFAALLIFDPENVLLAINT